MLPPLIDDRDMNALIRRMKEMYPFYTPEWRFTPEAPDPGTALFLIFAGMFQENIKRFNKVPLKNFIAFLNMFNVSLLPARPARGYITFKLSDGAREPVLIPAGTQVSGTAPEDGETVIYETQRDMLATPAAIVDAYNVSTRHDSIYKIPEGFFRDIKDPEKSPLVMFDFSGPDNLQEHSLYLGHDDLFNIRETAMVELELSNSFKRYKQTALCEKLAGGSTQWSYLGQDGWHAFDGVQARDNKIVLTKTKYNAMVREELEGIPCRWIRCQVRELSIEDVGDVEFDGLTAGAAYYDGDGRGGIAPDKVFYNDVQRDLEGFYPFGEFFVMYDNFYLSSQEVFSKKGSSVTIRFNLRHMENIMRNNQNNGPNLKDIMKTSQFDEPKLPEVSVLTVTWEYWNGKGWVKLLANREYEEIFYHAAGAERTIVFKCPGDIEETFVNDQFNYWIRARILSIQNIYTPEAVYRSPWIENIALVYDFPDHRRRLAHCLTHNNAAYLDVTAGLNGGGALIKPFHSFDLQQPAFYLGFDTPPVKGPLSIFFSIMQQRPQGSEIPLIEWEYLARKGRHLVWSVLKVVDGTNAFSRSGTVVFAGPPDYARGTVFGKELYWMRAVNRDGRFERDAAGPPRPVVKGIFMNTAGAVQHRSIKNEMLETDAMRPDREYELALSPVLSEEVWVNEAGKLTADEQERLAAGDLFKTELVKDGEGNILELWVKWQPVDDFVESGPEERHYLINRHRGAVRFGDGRNGKVPPSRGRDNVKVNYKIGGGARGNLAAFDISSLQNSIVFVDEVFNPEPFGGGCDMETREKSLHRGPQVLRHRNRAVTTEDFEWLAREASQNIARVKCLPNYNTKGLKETGCVTVVVMPSGAGAGSLFFPELKQQVERYLVDRASNVIALPGKIQVIEPAYLEMSVYADLVVDEMDVVAITEKNAVDKLNEFFDPLTGNFDGKGWEIGRYPHTSVLFALLKSTGHVNYVEKINITVEKIEFGQRTEINPELLGDLPHGMVTNGRHRVTVKLV